MKKIALATAALLVAAGSAFAENPNASWNEVSKDRPAIDESYTASIEAPNSGSGSHPADQYNSRLHFGN